MRRSLSGASIGLPTTPTTPLLRPELAVILLILSLAFSPTSFGRHHYSGFVVLETRLNPRHLNIFGSSPRRSLNAGSGSGSAEKESNVDTSRLPHHLVQSLDLAPIVRALADHAGTRRGREATLGLIGEGQTAARLLLTESEAVSSQRRRVSGAYPKNKRHKDAEITLARLRLAPIALSAEHARAEYELVEQAMLALEGINGVVFPPLYGATSSPWDTETIANTDYDEWLKFSSEEWTLEHILQADQIIQTLLQVHEWGNRTETRTSTPDLSCIARTISAAELGLAHNEIARSVEIVRVRSIVDPNGRSTFKFQLSEERFPALRILRETEQELQTNIERELDIVLSKMKGIGEVTEYENRMVLCVPKSQVADLGVVRGTTDRGVRCYVEPHHVISAGNHLDSIKNELATIEEKIERSLTQTILKASSAIDRGIHSMARLDVIFSKAAFGTLLNGAIPKVTHNGQIDVRDFVHPVLALRAGIATDFSLSESAVPIDLLLSQGQDSSAALIISGPNGGGKTVALKSFGVASLLTKLAIPIPQSSPHSNGFRPRIDFFDNVLVEVGDQQSVLEGESTLMARLNSFSSIITSVTGEHDSSSSREPSFFLVLMDELGAGTDPTAGGAIAQAVLEKLLESDQCRVVATTHSPRLKALSYNNSRFSCVTVLLKNDASSDFKRPSYMLQYGLIGDSYALGAASRSSPPLPDDVLSRAASLMTSASSAQEAENVDYLRALTESLEQETEAVLKTKAAMAIDREESHACRNAMVSLAETYADHLNNVEDRLQRLFRDLRDDESNSAVDVVGETIETLKLLRKKLKTEAEKLRERGLQKVPIDYQLTQGESVVIIADNEWRGASATVVQPHPEVENAVLVIPSIPTWHDALFQPNVDFLDDASITTKPLIMKRSDLAVWDMDSVWNDFDKAESPVTSVRESRQKLSILLSKLTMSTKDAGSTKPGPQKNSFKSARQRKAAKSKRKEK